MSKLSFLPLFFILLLLPVYNAAGQVQVTKSTETSVVDGKVYYLHTVLKGQTAFSISKAYGISVDELKNANPSISEGVKTGDVLKIPAGQNEDKKLQANNLPADVISKGLIYHYISEGETVYSLSKKYNVSTDEILKNNDGLSINDISVGTRIAIPVTGTSKQKSSGKEQKAVMTGQKSNITDQKTSQSNTVSDQKSDDGKSIRHTVQKGETLSSISRAYNVTLKDIKKANRGLLFPKEGDVIVVPVGNSIGDVKTAEPKNQVAENEKQAEVTEQVSEPVNEEKDDQHSSVTGLKGSVKVAVLFPFFINDNMELTASDSSDMDMPFIEMYEGLLIAADSLRHMGLKIELDVHDVTDDPQTAKKLISSGKLDNADLILGPIFSSSLEQVAAYASGRNIPVVSPVPLRDEKILNGNPTLFKICSSSSVEQTALARYVASFNDANIVFLYSDSLMYDQKTVSFRNKLSHALYDEKGSASFKELFISGRMIRKSNIYKDAQPLESKLSADKENIVVISTTDPLKVSAALSILNNLNRKYSIRVAGSSEIRTIETIDLKFFYDLRMMFPAEYYVDYSRPDVKAFMKSYYDKFRAEPDNENFAWRGFDMAYYFISATARYGKSIFTRIENYNPSLSSFDFKFGRSSKQNGFENQNMFIIQYNTDNTITATSLREIGKKQ